MTDNEYEEYEDFNNVDFFANRMVLSKMFLTLPTTFTYEQFAKAFSRTFRSLELSKSEVLGAFVHSLQVGLIDETDGDDTGFSFSGIAFFTEDYN